MIDLTVKTLDSQNHPFHVEDDITIRQFKEKISDCLNIPPDSQRLIFCGRVLQDDKKLSEYALVSGNTVHMVQRPPPQSGSRDTPTGASHNVSTNPRPTNGMRRSHTFRMMPSNVDRNAMYLGAMAYPADLMEAQGIQLPQPSSSLCASRLNIARRMLRRAGDVLAYLENPQSQPPRSTPSPTTVQVSQAVLEVGIAQIDGDSMDEGGTIAEAATAAAIAAAVSAAQEVGAPNITIFRGSTSTSGGDETVIHIEASDDNSTHNESSTQDNANASDNTGNDTNRQPGHSRSSSTDSFSSATEFPVGGNNQRDSANQNSTTENGQETNGTARNGNENASQPNTPLAPLAVLLDELNAIQTRLQPFMSQYHYILLQDPTYADNAAAVDAQRVYNRVSQVMHLLSHAYHAISDLMVDLHTPAPRYLRCRPILIQHSAVVQAGIPIQAEFNISNMMHQDGNNGNNNRQAGATRTETPATETTRPREEENTTATPTSTTESTTVVTSTEQNPPTFTFQNAPQANVQRQNFGFSLPDGITMGGNVEVVMEVTPRYSRSFTVDNSGNAGGTGTGNNGMGVTIPIPPPSNEMLSNIMQAVAGQIMNRMHGATVGVVNQQNATARSQAETTSATTSSSAGQNNANQPSQNSQARVNTATHPTTSTQTRSTSRTTPLTRPRPLTSSGIRLPAALGGHLGGVTSSFDPFLPCNSHHLRARRRLNTNIGATGASVTTSATVGTRTGDDNESASESAQATPTRRGRAPVPSGSTSGDGETLPRAPAVLLRDVFASQVVTETLQNAFVEVLDHAEDSGNMILDFIVQLARRTPLNEVFIMLMGDPSPLVRLRPVIRQFLITRLLENNTPSEEAYVEATQRVIDGLREHFQIMETVATRDNIDLTATLISLTRARMPEILSLAVDESDSGDRYGVQLLAAIRNFVQMFVGTVMHCCANGATGAGEVFRRYVDYVSRGADANLLMFTMSYSLAEFRHYMETVSVNPADIQQFIVYRSTGNTTTNTQQPQSMEVEEIAPARTSPPSNQTSPASSSNSTVVGNTRNVIKIPKSQVPSEQNNQQQGGVILPPIEMDLDSAEPVSNVVVGSQPWHNSLPADWVPIITRDVVRQRRQSTQSPMSDAYLQGMPSKRRKLITSQRPSINVAQSLQDNVRHTIQTITNQTTSNTGATINEIVAQAANDNNLLNAYREQLRNSLRTRLQQDPDFNPALYPNSEQKFK